MKLKLLFIVITTILLFNCANDSEDDLIDPTPIPAVVTYDADIKSIIDINCISCHSDPATSGASIPLTTYNQVKSAVENNNLIGRINGDGPGGIMPQGGPKLPQNTIDLIEKWQTDGLLKN
ncbi:hypothetical protein [Gaetbulibacter saemankumensis]|uniref:hypothetical protein n=1 Tax=Gaetbulibacter saemankumensis TaxID=311208 RepID=UPI00040DB6E4|nr:hypothetical protein [Gaetbulibacter saemankumensis]